MSDTEMRLSPAEMAALFGKTTKTLRNWRREFGFPGPEYGGMYDLTEVVRWLVEAWRVASKPVAAADAEARLTTAKAEKAEIEVSRLRGELVDRAAASRVVERAIVSARGLLMGIPRRIAAGVPQDDRPETEAFVLGEIETVLQELAEMRHFADDGAVTTEAGD